MIGGRDRSRNSEGAFNATQGLKEPFSEKIENRKHEKTHRACTVSIPERSIQFFIILL